MVGPIFYICSLVLCAVIKFYGYEGPAYWDWQFARWYKQGSTEAWIKDQSPNVWEIFD